MEERDINNVKEQNEQFFLMRNLPVPEKNVTSSSSSFNDVEVETSVLRSSVDMSSESQKPLEKAVQTEVQMASEMENSCTDARDLSLQDLQNQLSAIMVKTTQEIMVKAEEFNEKLLIQEELALSKEKERHMEEKQGLSQEITSLESNVQTLQAIIHKNSEVLMAMDKKIEQIQNDKLLLKYFLLWKTSIREKRREELLLRLATKHYEKNLKKKAFNAWMKLMRLNWKKRLELKITMEVYENQKSIVQNYEAKIRTLQDNAFEVGKQLKTLHRSFEGSVQMAFMQGLNRSKAEISNADLTSDLTNAKSVVSEESRLNESSTLRNLCDHCSSRLSDSSGSVVFFDVPPVSYKQVKDVLPKPVNKIHPSVLPKRLPVMGTGTHHNKLTTVTLCPNVHETVTVERHIPVIQRDPSHSPKKTSNLKNRSQKKLV